MQARQSWLQQRNGVYLTMHEGLKIRDDDLCEEQLRARDACSEDVGEIDNIPSLQQYAAAGGGFSSSPQSAETCTPAHASGSNEHWC